MEKQKYETPLLEVIEINLEAGIMISGLDAGGFEDVPLFG